MVRLALYQPDIPQNLGTILRLSACLQVPVDIIMPCGFPVDDKRIKRAGMDYIDHVSLQKHLSWDHFINWNSQLTSPHRLVLFTTKTDSTYTDFSFSDNDILLFGRESAGVPQEAVDFCDFSVTIPMHPPMRSFNVALSVAMGAGEALRQTRGFYHVS